MQAVGAVRADPTALAAAAERMTVFEQHLEQGTGAQEYFRAAMQMNSLNSG